MRKLALAVALVLSLGAAIPASAELTLGFTGGVVIPNHQDLVFKEYPQGGGPAGTVIGQDAVDESLGPLAGFTATAWGDSSFLQYFAFQLDTLYWYVRSQPSPTPPAPRFTVDQHRVGVLFSALARVPIYPDPGRFSRAGGDTFAYLGAGMGPVYSSVSHGASDWDLGFQFVAGISVPLVSKLRLRVEGRWLFTADVDTTPRDGPGWRVDVSGNYGPKPFGKHHDTTFYPVLVGLDWAF